MFFLFVLLFPLVNGQQQTRPCGTMQSYFSTESRIVGGELASAYAWPWQVYISLNGQFICGGTLIDKQHVATGAHCIIGQSDKASDFLVRVGAHNMVRQGYYAGTIYRVSAIFVHPNYVSAEYGDDIAIMRLAYSVDISDTVNVICLPPSTNFYVPIYAPVVITGFGLTTEGGSLPYTLQQAIIQIIPGCADAYSSYDDTKQICAGLPGGGRDTCQGMKRIDYKRKEHNLFFFEIGDSGGPLIYQPHKSDQWFLIGTTSYGNGCARINYPGVYTRVSYFLNWIQQVLSQK